MLAQRQSARTAHPGQGDSACAMLQFDYIVGTGSGFPVPMILN